MTNRYALFTFVLITALLFTGLTKASAGVITDVDANVISWDNAGTTYYFYKGSYNNTVVQPEAYEIGNAYALCDALRDDLNSPFNTLYIPTRFVFAVDPTPSRPTASLVNANSVHEQTGYYFTDTHYLNPDDTSQGGEVFYWASTTSPPNGTVPEPSTAIAMGLLGVVGFAGNRRRRRSATV